MSKLGRFAKEKWARLRAWLTDEERLQSLVAALNRFSQIAGEVLQEAGILTLVFGLLEHYMRDRPDPTWPQRVANVGVPILVAGMILRVVARERDR